jgi:hypothetical protein
VQGRGSERVVVGIEDYDRDGIIEVEWDFDNDGPLQLKMQWFVKQEPTHNVLLRIMQLDGDGTGAAEDGVAEMTLSGGSANDWGEVVPGADGWLNWAIFPWISGYGCYGMQVDGAGWSEQIVFEVRPGTEQ